MTEVHQARARGKGRDLPAALRCKALDSGDPGAMRAWVAHLRTRIEDLAGAAEDATRPPGQRLLGRAAARGVIEEARWTLDQLLAAATEG